MVTPTIPARYPAGETGLCARTTAPTQPTLGSPKLLCVPYKLKKVVHSPAPCGAKRVERAPLRHGVHKVRPPLCPVRRRPPAALAGYPRASRNDYALPSPGRERGRQLSSAGPVTAHLRSSSTREKPGRTRGASAEALERRAQAARRNGRAPMWREKNVVRVTKTKPVLFWTSAGRVWAARAWDICPSLWPLRCANLVHQPRQRHKFPPPPHRPLYARGTPLASPRVLRAARCAYELLCECLLCVV